MDLSPSTLLVRDASTRRWLRFTHPHHVLCARRVEEVCPLLYAVEQAVESSGRHAAGFLSYEAAPAMDPALCTRAADNFPLAWFGVYSAPDEIELPPPVSAWDQPVCGWQPSMTPQQYHAALGRIREYIGGGHTYQVNFTLRLWAPFAADPWRLFEQLRAAQDAAYSAFAVLEDWIICSASPELFFTLKGDLIASRPMKGTARRGLTLEEDHCQAVALQSSEKERAENVMIADMIRNDIGRIAEVGSVTVREAFAVERYPTLWQMTSTVEGHTRAGLTEILRALFPPASITGAPKPRTMAIIAELETAPRHIYTGTIGFIRPGRHAQFNVAIRTVLINRRRGLAEYGVGGGIVWDSDPEAEWRECQTKARILGRPWPTFELLETMRWTPVEGFFLLDRHLRRMADSAEYFGFPYPAERVRQKLATLAQGLPPVPHRVRLLLNRTGTPRCEAVVLNVPAPMMPVPVALSRTPIDDQNPFLYHKTTSRRVYEEALAACPGFADVLLYNARNEVTESTIANVVVECNGVRYTPPVRCGLLAGTYRNWLLEQGRLQERVLTVDDVLAAGRVLLINSVRGEYPVRVVTAPSG